MEVMQDLFPPLLEAPGRAPAHSDEKLRGPDPWPTY